MAEVRSRGADTDPSQPLEAEATLGELFSRLTDDFSSLVSTQLELAKVEIKDEAARAGKGAGMLTGGALAGYLAVILLSFAAAWGLAATISTGWAFLIVGVIWAGVAAALAVLGRNQFKEVHPIPPQTKAALKEDIEWARQQKN